MKRLSLSLALILLLGSSAHSQRPLQITILPFELSGFREAFYLQEAMVHMMASRIGRKGTFEIVDETRRLRPLPLGDPGYIEKAADAGRLLGADFVILGGLTKLGDTISLDSKAVEVKTAKVVARAYAVTKGLEGIAVKVEELADQISAGIEKHAASKPAPRQRSRETALAGLLREEPSLTSLERRIEALERRGVLPGSSLTAPAPSTAPRFDGGIKYNPPSVERRLASTGGKQIKIYGEGEEQYAKPHWESRTFFGRIMDVAVGDVTGDGKPELVVLHLAEMLVYRWDGKGFHQQIYAVRTDNPAEIFYSLDVADINQNGVAEIFVTALSFQFVNSFALEFKDKRFVRIWTGVDKYLRVLDLENGRRVLVGQAAGVDRPFWGPIKQISWQAGRYVEGASLALPEKANVYNFTVASLGGEERRTAAVFREDGEIGVHFKGSITRISKKKLTYGLHERFIEYNEVNTTVPGEQKPTRILHHGRLPLRDMDGNGVAETVTVKNDFTLADALLPAFKDFGEGAVVGLEWNGSYFDERWETKKIPGSVVNIALADVDGDGKDELLVAVLQPPSLLDQLAQVGQLNLVSILSPPRDTTKSSVYLFKF